MAWEIIGTDHLRTKPIARPIVTIYTAGPSCAACAATKRHLDRLGIPYTEILIDSNPNIIEAIGEMGLSTAPVVCVSTVGLMQYWDGYRPDRIDALVWVSG